MKKIKTGVSAFFMGMSLLCFMQNSYAQAVGTPYIPMQEPPIPFSFLSGGSTIDVPTAMDQTTDGGYIVAGTSNSSANGNVTGTNHGNQDFWVVKYNKLGKIEWQRLYGGNAGEQGNAIKQTSDGGYIVAGSVQANSANTGDVGALNGGTDAWVLKLTATGAISWQKGYGGTGNDFAKAVLQTSDGYIFSGISGSFSNGNFWAVKLDVSGNVVWQNNYNNPGTGTGESLYCMAAAGDGTGYILGGSSGTSGSTLDLFTMKINLTGAAQWKKVYGGNQDDLAIAAASMPDGGSIVVGASASSANGNVTGTGHGGDDIWIIRLDASGNIIWQQLYGGAASDRGYSVRQTADGGFIVAGVSASSATGNVTGTNHGANDVWLLKLSSTGSIQWQKLYGGTGGDGLGPISITQPQPVKVMQAPDGGFIVAATSTSSLNGDVTDTNNNANPVGSQNTDYWLFKTDASGTIIQVPDIGQR